MDNFWRNPIFYWKCDSLSPSLSSFAVQAAGKNREGQSCNKPCTLDSC